MLANKDIRFMTPKDDLEYRKRLEVLENIVFTLVDRMQKMMKRIDLTERDVRLLHTVINDYLKCLQVKPLVERLNEMKKFWRAESNGT